MKSSYLFKQGRQWIPGGVNSPVRAFRAVSGEPVFMSRGKGPYIWDESGRRYVDFCLSWGPLLFGHAPPGLIQTLRREINRGTSFGTATAKEVRLAEKICTLCPSIEKVRLVSSGTEAVMSAVRLARGYTGKKMILKIDGGYHGHADSLLVKAGSGLAAFGLPDSAGVPPELAKLTLSIPFNDTTVLERTFKKYGKKIAAFILEPVPANMGVILPEKGYLEAARRITRKHGALLIFDEVITGFRLSPGGAQQYFNVRADLTCLGKILGGGLPLAAFGGKKEIMNRLAPGGPVYQAGTLSGNPVAVTAALWTLDQISANREARGATGEVRNLNGRAADFFQQLQDFLKKTNLKVELNAISSMFTLFFTASRVTDYASAKKSNIKKFAKFFHYCLKRGLYLSPSQYEANFISFAHDETVLKRALLIMGKGLRQYS